MIGNVEGALRALLVEALPELFGGTAPKVQLTVTSESLELDPTSAEAIAGEPRPDERVDVLAFDPAKPQGPYTLAQPPYEGPRRIRLRTKRGDALTLKESEVAWDAEQPRVFQLALRPERDVADMASVEAVYTVLSVFTTLKARQSLGVKLASGEPAAVVSAQALVLSVVALNRQALIEQGRRVYQTPGYSAEVMVETLQILGTTSTNANASQLTLHAALALKAIRTLAGGEGATIQRTDINVRLE